MFKKILLTILITFSFSLASNPICSINQELNKDTLSKLDKYRPQTLQTCLDCNDGTCAMKAWPVEKKADAAICKLLFCTPAYVSKVFKKPEGAKSGKTKINFTYVVNGEGKIKNLDITEAKGAMNSRESYKYLQSFTKKTQYKPLMVNGTPTSISLQGEHIAYTGKYEDPDKTMPARSDTWRN
ncbi:MAG: hypothetical protein QF527_03365 [SAR86 cluster bacterium]|nr:hypothetical protein [SAR86 cluster bacterium]